tara:strand:+ start:171 stop:890 length:720 start_codon:yes stop_codon:yes gene_type:complete
MSNYKKLVDMGGNVGFSTNEDTKYRLSFDTGLKKYKPKEYITKKTIKEDLKGSSLNPTLTIERTKRDKGKKTEGSSTLGVELGPKFKGIYFKKKFDKGGYSEQDFPILKKPIKKGRKPSLSEQEKDYQEFDYGFDKDIDIVEIPTFKRGGDNMPARNKKNFRPTEKGAGMTRAGVAAYRRANPGSKLKTAVTGKVKPGSTAAKRRKSFCARSAGQMKKFPKAAKDPNSRLRQARRRWKC